MKNGIYNKAVYWPEELQTKIQKALNRKYKLGLTFHANTKIQKLKLPKNCYKVVLYGEVVEAEIQNGNLVKVITRLKRDNRFVEQDICAAVAIYYPYATVKTVWINETNDKHKTLKIENYISNPIDKQEKV